MSDSHPGWSLATEHTPVTSYLFLMGTFDEVGEKFHHWGVGILVVKGTGGNGTTQERLGHVTLQEGQSRPLDEPTHKTQIQDKVLQGICS